MYIFREVLTKARCYLYRVNPHVNFQEYQSITALNWKENIQGASYFQRCLFIFCGGVPGFNV